MFDVKDFYKRKLHSVLGSIAEYQKPNTYLEIGVREGDSLKAVLEHSQPSEIWLCDTWGETYGGTGRGNHHHISELLIKMNFDGYPVFMNGDSKIFIPTIRREIRFDLILVDGDHSYDGAYKDLENVWPLLQDGGLIVFDDIVHVSHKYLLNCIKEFTNEYKADLVYITFEDNGVVVIQK